MFFKRCILHLSRWFGLFHVARRVTGQGLRILCYHGFALSDESRFRPKLFIRPSTFEKRMKYLSGRAGPVIGLDEALNLLEGGNLPRGAAVVTIDDGHYSVLQFAVPILLSLHIPTTIYVASYHAVKQTPVFRLVVQYIFWKTGERELSTVGLGIPVPEIIPLRDLEKQKKGMWEIIRFAERNFEEEQRCELARTLGERLRVDYDSLTQERNFSLMTPDEIRSLAAAGFDVQLHTHRHDLPEDEALIEREIQENRRILEPLVTRELKHFCYPSGIWSRRHWPMLDALGIKSATTCDPGLNYRHTPRLGLKRFLDGEDVAQIEFEAELSGFTELIRSARLWFRRFWSALPRPIQTPEQRSY